MKLKSLFIFVIIPLVVFVTLFEVLFKEMQRIIVESNAKKIIQENFDYVKDLYLNQK